MTMSPIGFPAQKTHAMFATLMRSLRDQSDTARTEAVTGLSRDPAKASGGKIAEIMDIERSLGEIGDYTRTIALTEVRTRTTQASLGTVADVVDHVANQVTLAFQNSGRNGLEASSAVARDGLRGVIAALNVSLAGRGVFAGDAGDAGTVASAETVLSAATVVLSAEADAAAAHTALRAAFDDPGGLFETSLYLGGTADAPSAEVAEGERIAYHVRADEGPLRDVLRSLATLGAAYDTANTLTEEQRDGLARRALDDLRNTPDPLNRIRARIGSAEARIETVKASHVANEAALTLGYNALAGRDTLEAASLLQETEGQLEILFLTTARMSSLSLANFLR